jgi:hypothetical protein
MFSRRLIMFWFALPCLGLLGAVHANAQLATKSPFLPPPVQNNATVTEGAPFELRGITAAGGGVMFSIFDPAKKTGMWVRLNEPGNDFMVTKYDTNNDTVTVEHQGRPIVLALRESKVVAASYSTPTVRPNTANTPPMVPTAINPTPGDEARRLEAFQAEVNRRREARRQAMEKSNQPNQTPIIIPPPPGLPRHP